MSPAGHISGDAGSLYEHLHSMWPDSTETHELLIRAEGGEHSAVNLLMERHRQSLRQMVLLRMDRVLTGTVTLANFNSLLNSPWNVFCRDGITSNCGVFKTTFSASSLCLKFFG